MQTKMCYVDICFCQEVKESFNNETKIKKFYISNQDTLISLKEIQQQIISFDKSLETMWQGRDAKLQQHVLFI